MTALKRGDKVIATTRATSFTEIQDLQGSGANIMELDVTASLEDLKQVAVAAVAIHGKVDVVVNNAGKSLPGRSPIHNVEFILPKGFLSTGALKRLRESVLCYCRLLLCK